MLCYGNSSSKDKKRAQQPAVFSLFFRRIACLTKLVVCILTKWKLVLITVICHRNGDNTVRSKNTKKSHKMCMACLSSTTVSSDVLPFSFATFFLRQIFTASFQVALVLLLECTLHSESLLCQIAIKILQFHFT